MIDDNRGQVSFEYLLIFTVSLIILLVFTMPLINQTVKTTMDISDSMAAKSDLSKIALAIDAVYGEGQGSKHTVNIHSTKFIKVNVGNDYLYSNIKLNDKNKLIKVSCKSNLKSSSINIYEGGNTVVVEWPIGSEKMLIYNDFSHF